MLEIGCRSNLKSINFFDINNEMIEHNIKYKQIWVQNTQKHLDEII